VIAEDVHNRFGGNVDLQVGALTYPDGNVVPSEDWVAPRPTVEINNFEISVNLEGPNKVASGFELETALRVHNLVECPLNICTSEVQGLPETRIVSLDDGRRGWLSRVSLSTHAE
jgi:hypothetical protein